MRKTLLMEAIEMGMAQKHNPVSISVYLHMKMQAGWKLWEIREDIWQQTHLDVSLSSLSLWTRSLGYAKVQAAEAAWAHRLIPQSELQERSTRITRIYKVK